MAEPSKKPIHISATAQSTLTYHLRQWSGWDKAVLSLSDTDLYGNHVETASSWHDPVFGVTVNPEFAILNPNRVLKTVTPFRLRQEAVLTGTLLHEAGHARYSHWQPGRYGNPEQAVHGDTIPEVDDGTSVEPRPVSDLALALAKTAEEARVEGLMIRDAKANGVRDLAWTMRVQAMKTLPQGQVNLDPNQQVLDVLNSWLLRVGRQIAASHHSLTAGAEWTMPEWVKDFNEFVGRVVGEHIVATKIRAMDEEPLPLDEPSAEPERTNIVTALYEMVTAGDEASAPGSTYMVDTAQKVLDLLFPPEDQDGLVMPDQHDDAEDDPDSDDQPGEDQPEDDENGDESDDQGEDGEEGQSEDDEPGDGDSEGDSDSEGNGDNDTSEAGGDDSTGEGDESGEQGEGNTEPDDEGSGDDPGAGDSGNDDAEPSDKPGESDQSDQRSDAEKEKALNKQADIQAELEDMEAAAAKQAAEEQREEVANPAPAEAEKSDDGAEQGEQADSDGEGGEPGDPGGKGAGSVKVDGWGNAMSHRRPAPFERESQRGAEKFLRNLIDPSEGSTVSISDSPSAQIDGGALAAWKAGGQQTDPRFFRRIRRTAKPAPPVEIAVLVDRSGSMDVLDKPSALLSWALASAAVDLRNFAGRGVQVQSTMIHWGSNARVIQANGEMLPGIMEGACTEGTVAMDDALDLVAQQLPGFFAKDTGSPRNRLLVQFTDWELAGWNLNETASKIATALNAGVNMLSVVPAGYNYRRAKLDDILHAIDQAGIERVGKSHILHYNPRQPDRVWDTAATMLEETD